MKLSHSVKFSIIKLAVIFGNSAMIVSGSGCAELHSLSSGAALQDEGTSSFTRGHLTAPHRGCALHTSTSKVGDLPLSPSQDLVNLNFFPNLMDLWGCVLVRV